MIRRDITIKTADGEAPARLFGDGEAGVIVYMDAFGLRAALDSTCWRLAGEGYTVIQPDLFYRFGAYGPFDAKTAFSDEKTAAQLRHMIGSTTQAMTAADTAAFIATLEQAGVTGPIGTLGYCMGGGRALHAAAAYPDRVVAAASIHGGNLASDAEDSPHRQAGRIKGRVYIGVAGVDRSFPPEQSARLAQALREAEVDHIIENYVGMEHGWAVIDHNAFHHDGAERLWSRLAAFFGETLRKKC